MLNTLLTSFYGKLTTKKWATITKCSADTALRDINDLVEKGMLKKSNASGRSTSYEVMLWIQDFNKQFSKDALQFEKHLVKDDLEYQGSRSIISGSIIPVCFE